MNSRQKALEAMEAALEKKALEPMLLEVKEHSSYTDYILLLSGRSDRHVQAVADAVIDGSAENPDTLTFRRISNDEARVTISNLEGLV